MAHGWQTSGSGEESSADEAENPERSLLAARAGDGILVGPSRRYDPPAILFQMCEQITQEQGSKIILMEQQHVSGRSPEMFARKLIVELDTGINMVHIYLTKIVFINFLLVFERLQEQVIEVPVVIVNGNISVVQLKVP